MIFNLWAHLKLGPLSFRQLWGCLVGSVREFRCIMILMQDVFKGVRSNNVMKMKSYKLIL